MTGSRPPTGATRALRVMEAALWTGASLLVLTAHVGAALWLMREAPMVAADATPPAAIMIELADEAEAVDTQENEISEAMEDAEASKPAENVPTPDETPFEEVVEDLPEPEPEEIVEEVAEDDDPVDEDVALIPEAEVPIPLPRPAPPEPKREVVKAEPRKTEPRRQKPRPQQQQAASQATRQAKAQVKEGARTAARQSASGVSSMSPARWQSRLMAHLERRKKYPADARRRGERGTVHVRFSIDDAGNVRSVTLARSSGYPALDNEVLSLVRRASPVPAPPPGVNRTIVAPVRFSVR
ncbi:energy transducer TonB family protein [Hoeflea olei]|uniref:Energy transducer TonB n=1 Tax=Hoeflea olei TaxID=1480615 RepID=A0A1C1YY83_9HYPH|nr:energy transducer TonB [Hoeflea olei]OCW58366.1 energy transducer TonB [Hoeflea olei]